MLAFLVVIASFCGAQTPAAPPSSQYLLRIGHVIPHMDTCALLQSDGTYHFERHSNGNSQVREGQLTAEELNRVKGWLDDQQVEKFTSEQIVRPLLITDMELWQFNIFRGTSRQDLLFPGMESMKPFRGGLAPLMEWFNGLHNLAHRVIPEDAGRNNCLPSREIALRPRQGQNIAVTAEKSAGSAPPVAPAFLVRWKSESNIWQQYAWRTCAIVYGDGHYRLEKSSQAMRGGVESQVYEGSMSASQLEGLRRLLEKDSLAESPDILIPESAIFAASRMTSAWVPRGDRIQHLEFADTVAQAAIGNHYEIRDPNTKLIRPVEKWLRGELKADKASLVKGASPNSCATK